MSRLVVEPELIDLYQELAGEDRLLAEQGMADYATGLRQADEA